MPVIAVGELTKTYRTFKGRPGVMGHVKDLFFRRHETLEAVKSISFSVQEGELLGYIGPNGAGKSTSIKMLTGILKPTSGHAEVLGFEPYRDRKQYVQHIGVVFGQRTQLWWDIAVRESFRLLAKIYNIDKRAFEERMADLSAILELDEVMATPVRKLSLGQRMRCDLAASLLHRPRVLFLDEPTIGLDAFAKDSIRAFLRRINRGFGTTIILTTHDLREIEELCQRIVVIDKGRIIYDGSLCGVKALPGLKRTLTLDFPGEVPRETLRTVLGSEVEIHSEGERRVSCQFDPQQYAPAEVIRKLLSSCEVADLSLAEPSIEQVIMKIYRGAAQ